VKARGLSTYFALHLLLMLYSVSDIASKLAAGKPFMSWEFIGLYLAVIAILAIYALGWQQVIKRMPLTTAYANRGITVVWGIIWGAVFFAEGITPLKALGAALIIAGIALFAYADRKAQPADAGSDGAHGDGDRA
jgi:multidrug transporter EmrE-like cation transporter